MQEFGASICNRVRKLSQEKKIFGPIPESGGWSMGICGFPGPSGDYNCTARSKYHCSGLEVSKLTPNIWTAVTLLYLFIFETGFFCVIQAGLEHREILLLQSPKHWDYMCAPLHLAFHLYIVYGCLWAKWQNSCITDYTSSAAKNGYYLNL